MKTAAVIPAEKTLPNIFGIFKNDSTESLCVKIPYEKLRWLSRFPVWNMIQDFIRSTRSYREGLALSVSLISTSEKNSNRMTTSEKEFYRDRLWEFHLDMLDKLDMWTDYLNCFNKLRSQTEFCHKWKRSSGIESHPHIKHYICLKREECLFIHFLISRHERKQIIERKLARLNAGKTTNHLKHHTRAILSSDELNERVKHLIEKFTPYMPLC